MDTLVVLMVLLVSFAAAQIKICQKNAADIVFILDESGSIWGPDFDDRQLPFVENVVNMFDVSPTTTQVGVLTFSDDPKVHFHLDTYNNKAEIANAVKTIKQRRGGTNTFDALQFMREVSFSKKHGARDGVVKIGIILSDGESADPTKTALQAQKAKEAGINLFAIAVGVSHRGNKQKTLEAELREIASDPDSNYFFKVEDYSSLESIKKKLAIRACEVTTIPPTTTTTTQPTTTLPQMIEGCRGRHTIDAVFALSDTAVPADTITAIDFVKTLAKDAEISPEKIQVGLAPSTCEITEGIKLNDCPNKKKLMAELEKRKPSGSHPEKTMKTMQTNSYTEAEGGRSESVKFGIVFVDAKLGDPEEAIKQSELTRDGVQLIIVAVGNAVKDDDTVKELATSESHYFWVQNYSQLADIKTKIGKLFCDGVKNGGRTAADTGNFMAE